MVHDLVREPVGKWTGFFLARKLVDEMHYERVDGKNILRVTKKF